MKTILIICIILLAGIFFLSSCDALNLSAVPDTGQIRGM